MLRLVSRPRLRKRPVAVDFLLDLVARFVSVTAVAGFALPVVDPRGRLLRTARRVAVAANRDGVSIADLLGRAAAAYDWSEPDPAAGERSPTR